MVGVRQSAGEFLRKQRTILAPKDDMCALCFTSVLGALIRAMRPRPGLGDFTAVIRLGQSKLPSNIVA